MKYETICANLSYNVRGFGVNIGLQNFFSKNAGQGQKSPVTIANKDSCLSHLVCGTSVGQAGTPALRAREAVIQNAHIGLHKYAEIQQNPVFMHVGTRGTMGQDQGKSKKAKRKTRTLNLRLETWDLGRQDMGQMKLKSKKVKGKTKHFFDLSASLRLCGVILTLTFALTAQTRDFTRWVNPFIGTGGHGHTFPGATMPFGMVQLSPDTRTDNWDGSSGYHYSDDIIYGFSHTHLSGTGIPDYCDILFMPSLFDQQKSPKEDRLGLKVEHFSHADEAAAPGFYTVKMRDGIA